MNDQSTREQALNPTQSFIVQAPAGSGKTELLTQRYLVLLAHVQKAPEEIIAITFTRKAAAQMRARVISALEFSNEKEPDKNNYRHTTWQLAKNVLEKDHALNWTLMQNPNRLRILTMDALSAFLCRQTPMLTNVDGLPNICENAASLYQLAAQKLLMDISAEKKWQGALESLLLHLDNRVEKLQHLLADLLNHRDQWLPSILYCYQQYHQLRETLEKSLKNIVLEKMYLASKNIPEHLKQMLVLLVHHVGNYFLENKPEHILSACANFAVELKPALSQFSSWLALANLLLTKAGDYRKSVDIKIGFAPKDENKKLMLSLLTQLQAHESFKESLHDILCLPPMRYTALQWETLTALTQLLPLLAAQLTLVFQEKRQIDFIELNLRALKALGSAESPTDLALYLDYQIHHLLIDEFQDTSVLHLHLLEKIIAGWEKNDGRTLFVVGDPMQSIYRFRNAEVGLFLRAQQQGIANISLEPLTLTMNFRSQANVVSWFNNTFQTVFPTVSDIATGSVPYTKAIAAKESLSENNVHFYPIISDDDKIEAKLLAEQIKLIQTKNPNDSLAILVRSRAQLIPIIYFLQKNKLNYQAIDIEPLSSRTEIRDLLSLTRALLHRADRIAWLALLRAPFCGLTLNDLEIIAHAAETKTIWEVILQLENSTKLSIDGLNRLKKMRYYLQHAFQLQYQLPLAQWIEGVWIALGGPAGLSDAIELNHARTYFNLVEKMENDADIISIEKLSENCEQLFAHSENTATTAIQIMTIHKSKGLEFDHVFIPGLHRHTPPDHQKLLRWLNRPNALGGDDLILAPIKSIEHTSDPIDDYLKKIENEKQDHEVTRLLYVATTRAKRSLHLFTLLKYSEGGSKYHIATNSFLYKVWPVYESTISTYLITPVITQVILNKTPSLLTRLTNNVALPLHASVSEISQPIKMDIHLHSQSSRIIGTVIHEILQNSAKINFEKKQWRSRLISLGLLPHEMDNAIATIQTAITNIISDERGKWILFNHAHAQSEWALTSMQDNAYEHFIIDRSFIDKNNTRWIIDYKTAKPSDHESLENFLKEQKKQYAEKMQTYANIIASMENRPTRLGLYFPLCCGWIEWEISHSP